MKLYDKSKVNFDNLIFNNKAVYALIIPIVMEQLFNSFMGMADTMMVANVGDAAVSAVSLVDSINLLVIQVFSALSAGATIICSQYIGRSKDKESNNAARQVIIAVLAISLSISFICIVFRRPLLALIFGTVEDGVMEASLIYFLITALSFPFIALFNAGSSFYRAGGESRFPMIVSAISNVINIAFNAILIFGLNMGVAGAAYATLLSRIFCVVVIYYYLRKPKQAIVIRDYTKFRPDFPLILKLLAIGIPAGVENGLFQFGKLAIQSSVSTLGTTEIAANAMATIFENVNGIGAVGLGIGLMTMVGQCMGAGRVEEAKYYIVKITKVGFVVVLLSCLFVYAIARPVLFLSGLNNECIELCLGMVTYITITKPLFWNLAFVPFYGMRAAGDVKFSMISSSTAMWFCRVALTTFLIRTAGFGAIAVWIGMSVDWFTRAVISSIRYLSGKWVKEVI